jgi:hypothetical protein
VTTNDGPRISQQYRDRERRMVYEVQHGTSLLVLLASEGTTARDEWRFEAHSREAPQLCVTGSWEASRKAAFETMRDLWIQRGEALGLAHVDWAKVADALLSVRAI